ncbi:hypothetical protein Bca4012_090421 [Brassica carinata]|uniref:Uncharacterized protein n=2 Tax=Brassica TaxID=3705 RepID=A0A3P6F3X1_BRAOL|nr:unnamed protein product [Brassica napus]VDD52187.1 unnamed protein product [Brassica oleracea]
MALAGICGGTGNITENGGPWILKEDKDSRFPIPGWCPHVLPRKQWIPGEHLCTYKYHRFGMRTEET